MEPECLLPCSEEPTSGPCLEPDESSHNFPPHLPKIHSNIIFQSTLSGLFLSGLPIKILYASIISSIRSECPTHLQEYVNERR